MSETAEEYRGVFPQLAVRDAAAAIEFYREAFGADELIRNLDPTGRIMHAELLLGGGRIYVHDAACDTDGRGDRPSTTSEVPSIVLHLYVADTDATFARALGAGAIAVQSPHDVFWGDRYAQLDDPQGVRWSLATRCHDFDPDDLADRARQWSEQQRPQP